MTFPALLGSPFDAAQVAQVRGQFGIHASANVARRLESAFTATGASGSWERAARLGRGGRPLRTLRK